MVPTPARVGLYNILWLRLCNVYVRLARPRAFGAAPARFLGRNPHIASVGL
jgi:hypothetical protein